MDPDHLGHLNEFLFRPTNPCPENLIFSLNRLVARCANVSNLLGGVRLHPDKNRKIVQSEGKTTYPVLRGMTREAVYSHKFGI